MLNDAVDDAKSDFSLFSFINCAAHKLVARENGKGRREFLQSPLANC